MYSKFFFFTIKIKLLISTNYLSELHVQVNGFLLS